jgi:glycolate oxidase iron-sulfur subunit
LMNGLRRRGERTLPAFHLVELLDASIRGLTADQILRGEKSLNFPTSSST